MTERERFIETLLFGKPDRIPLQPGGPRESTLAAWRTQGLPEGVHYHDFLLDTRHLRGAVDLVTRTLIECPVQSPWRGGPYATRRPRFRARLEIDDRMWSFDMGDRE